MASTKDWFETVEEAQHRAKKRLPRSVYLALVAGTEKGLTAADNVAAFDEIAWRPHVADLHGKRELATTVMGQEVSMPVLVSPTGVQAVLLEGRKPDTVVVVGRDVGGPEESVTVTTLGEFDPETVDMRCLVLIGSSQTRVTPSGAVFTSRRYPGA